MRSRIADADRIAEARKRVADLSEQFPQTSDRIADAIVNLSEDGRRHYYRLREEAWPTGLLAVPFKEIEPVIQELVRARLIYPIGRGQKLWALRIRDWPEQTIWPPSKPPEKAPPAPPAEPAKIEPKPQKRNGAGKCVEKGCPFPAEDDRCLAHSRFLADAAPLQRKTGAIA